MPAAIVRADRSAARERFGIDPEVPCLLIFGGSLGALRINRAAAEAFGPAGPAADRPFHVLHIAGARDYPVVAPGLEGATRYTLLEYLPDLGDALAASDLVLCRSGGSVFELTAAGRPAVLVPYPYASGRHQHANARWMADAGAATIVEDEDLDAERLRAEVEPLLADRARLEGMGVASRGSPGPTPPTGSRRDPRRGSDRRQRDERARTRQPLHFIAIGGAGMSGLALVCHRLGHRVTGSDRAESAYLERLRVAGIEPVVGHDADAVPADAEVVVSTAIPEDNVELVRARERGQTRDPPQRPARAGLRRQAPDRRRRRPRQDDDRGDDRPRARDRRRRPGLPARRRAARRRARRSAGERRLGQLPTGSSPRPTRATAAS